MNKNAMVLWGLLMVSLPFAHAARADEEATQLQNALEKYAPAIVTVKVVMKTAQTAGGQSRDSESKMDMLGVVVDKDGLVMLSNAIFSPARYMGMMGRNREGFDVKVIPTSFKVLFEQEDKEYTAFLAATDTKLDLTFIQIENLGDHKVTPVDFTSAASLSIGQKVVSVSRMHKGFDYAPFFETARISGTVMKPRKAWMLDGNPGAFGLPIYALTGEPVGVLTTLDSGLQDDSLSETIGFSAFMRAMTGGGGGILRSFLVPSPAVNGVIQQAKKRAVEVAAERAKKKTTGATDTPKKPVTGEKPAKPKK